MKRLPRETVDHTFEELGKSLCWIDVRVIIEAGEPRTHDYPGSEPEVVDVIVVAWGDEYGPCKIHPSWSKTLCNIAAKLVSDNYRDVLERLE
jgi:hypothetical protein